MTFAGGYRASSSEPELYKVSASVPDTPCFCLPLMLSLTYPPWQTPNKAALLSQSDVGVTLGRPGCSFRVTVKSIIVKDRHTQRAATIEEIDVAMQMGAAFVFPSGVFFSILWFPSFLEVYINLSSFRLIR